MKNELVNRVIYSNSPSPKDYCRFVIYDETRTIDDPKWMRKAIKESFCHPKPAHFTIYRDGQIELEFTEPGYDIKDILCFTALAQQEKFTMV